MGDFDFDVLSEATSPALATGLFIAYVVIGAIILLNLLIALMADTYDKVNQDLDSQWRLEQAHIILDIESQLGPHRGQADGDEEAGTHASRR